jgi:uncharacterized protein YyaL (SSP411 family)
MLFLLRLEEDALDQLSMVEMTLRRWPVEDHDQIGGVSPVTRGHHWLIPHFEKIT